jgi:hypothetical protein
MSLFEFIVSMIGVLIALTIAQLLISVGRLAQRRQRVRTYLPHTLWVVAIFLFSFLHWWSLWDFRDLAWNSAMFFYSLMGPLLLFFSVTLLNPEPRDTDEVIELEAHFHGVRVMFLLVVLAGLLFLTFDGPLFGTEPWFNRLRSTQLCFALAIVAAVVVDRNWMQALAAVVVVTLLLLATTLRFLPGAFIWG